MIHICMHWWNIRSYELLRSILYSGSSQEVGLIYVHGAWNIALAVNRKLERGKGNFTAIRFPCCSLSVPRIRIGSWSVVLHEARNVRWRQCLSLAPYWTRMVASSTLTSSGVGWTRLRSSNCYRQPRPISTQREMQRFRCAVASIKALSLLCS
jgi:hypothetical protein